MPVSAQECAASAVSDADPVTTAATDLATATRRLAPSATSTVTTLSDPPGPITDRSAWGDSPWSLPPTAMGARAPGLVRIGPPAGLLRRVSRRKRSGPRPREPMTIKSLSEAARPEAPPYGTQSPRPPAAHRVPPARGPHLSRCLHV